MPKDTCACPREIELNMGKSVVLVDNLSSILELDRSVMAEPSRGKKYPVCVCDV